MMYTMITTAQLTCTHRKEWLVNKWLVTSRTNRQRAGY